MSIVETPQIRSSLVPWAVGVAMGILFAGGISMLDSHHEHAAAAPNAVAHGSPGAAPEQAQSLGIGAASAVAPSPGMAMAATPPAPAPAPYASGSGYDPAIAAASGVGNNVPVVVSGNALQAVATGTQFVQVDANGQAVAPYSMNAGQSVTMMSSGSSGHDYVQVGPVYGDNPNWTMSPNGMVGNPCVDPPSTRGRKIVYQ